MRIAADAAAVGVGIRWRAMLLGPIFQAQGWSDSPFNLFPAKGRYMWADMDRICRDAGLDFSRPAEFPRNGLLAARIVCAHEDQPWTGEFVRQVFAANFADDLDIAQPEVIIRCIQRCGVTPAPVIEAAKADAAKLKLRERTAFAGNIGIFGAPSFVADGELFWGNERIEHGLHAARTAASR